MDRIPHTMPISDLRSKQAAVLKELDQGPVLLTKQGRAAAVLVHPDYWNQLAALLEEMEDAVVAEQRLVEAQEDESVMAPLADAKRKLAALS